MLVPEIVDMARLSDIVSHRVGAVVTTLPGSMSFNVKRGWYRLTEPLTGHIAFSLPNTRIDPRDIISGNGNIWIGSLERTSQFTDEDQ